LGATRIQSTKSSPTSLEQPIRVTLCNLSMRRAQNLSQSTRFKPSNNHQHGAHYPRCSKPSRWWQPPRNKKSGVQRWTRATRCKLTKQMNSVSPQSHFGSINKQESEWEVFSIAQGSVGSVRMPIECPRVNHSHYWVGYLGCLWVIENL
jgi:hypothetical protein